MTKKRKKGKKAQAPAAPVRPRFIAQVYLELQLGPEHDQAAAAIVVNDAAAGIHKLMKKRGLTQHRIRAEMTEIPERDDVLGMLAGAINEVESKKKGLAGAPPNLH